MSTPTSTATKRNETSIFEFLRNGPTPAQVDNAWFDWFCKDTSLPKRATKLVNLLRTIHTSVRFDATKCYVFFKNNCPMNGGTYDSMSICRIDGDDVLFWIGFLGEGCHGSEQAHIEVACGVGLGENDLGSFKNPAEFNTTAEVVRFFNGQTIQAIYKAREAKLDFAALNAKVAQAMALENEIKRYEANKANQQETIKIAEHSIARLNDAIRTNKEKIAALQGAR